MMVLPDSPRWYALKGRLDDTRRVLELTRAPADAQAEYDLVVEHAREGPRRGQGLRAGATCRRTSGCAASLFVGIGLAVVQQATGINTAIYYAPTILESTGLGTSAALVATIAVGVISVTDDARRHLPAGLRQPAPAADHGFHRRRALPGGARAAASCSRSRRCAATSCSRSWCVRRLRPVLHRHRRVAAAVGDLPHGHPGLRDGHRRVRPLDRQRARSRSCSRRHGRTLGRDGDVRAVRARSTSRRSSSSRASSPRRAAARSRSSRTSSASTRAGWSPTGRRPWRCRAPDPDRRGVPAAATRPGHRLSHDPIHGDRMKIALDPYMFRHVPLLELPALVAELGYEYIELSPRPDFIPFFVHPRADRADRRVPPRARRRGGRDRVRAPALSLGGTGRGGAPERGPLLEARDRDHGRARRGHV